MSNLFKFKGTVWVYGGNASWYFVTLPKHQAKILKTLSDYRRGFGSIKVLVILNGDKWLTSLFPDTKSESYLLPLKKEIRTKHAIEDGMEIDIAFSPVNV